MMAPEQDPIEAAWAGASTHPSEPETPRAPTTVQYEVRSPGGALIAIHERSDGPDGKRMYWCQPDGRLGLGGTPMADLPLYGSERAGGWDPERPVLVAEGEKAAQALIDAGHQAVGTVTGASSTPGPEALAVLIGRDVVLWPDNDKVGAEHMGRIAERLREVASSIHTLVWDDAPPHGDAADYLTASMVDVTIEELIARARHEPLFEPQELRPGGTGMDAADLLALELPPLRWVVPDLLPEGTTILAAPPKVGKSCLVYQVAVEASIGGDLFDRRVTPGSVLYLALEDGQRRGQDRLRAALAGRTMPRGRLEVRWSAPPIGQGLEESLVDWLDTHDDAILVAIDTLQKVRAPGDSRRNAYEVDVADLGRLQNLVRDRAVGLLVVHHARKASTDDFLTSVSGTYGITGSADTTIVVQRKRIQGGYGELHLTGRDVAEAKIPVHFDDMLWRLAPATVSAGSFEQAEIYRVILANGPLFAKAIGDLLGMSRQAVQNKIPALLDEGLIVRTPRGYAAAANEFSAPVSPARARVDVPHVPAVSERNVRHDPHTPARAHASDPTSLEERYQATFDEQEEFR